MAATINIIGAGRVGQTLLRVLTNAGSANIGDVLSSRYENAARAVSAVGQGRAVQRLEEMKAAHLWLITVPDDQITIVAEEMARDLPAARHGEETDAPVAIHFSGILPSTALKPLRDFGWLVASCHPVLSFADSETAAAQFAGTFCGIEGDRLAIARLNPLLLEVGGRPFSLNADHKALYHAAAVFSNNFTVVLQALAMEAWAQSGVDPDIANALCSSLLDVASANVRRLGPQAALTGPAARGDRKTIALQHARVAQWYAKAGEVYSLLSDMAYQLKRNGTVRSNDILVNSRA
ncbi:Rossmann-like and DUF2520 domain-containing protein [Bradyrhizobium sp. Arg314]